MKRQTLISLSLLALAAPAGAAPRSPVVVELFTAQGCASCANANALAAQMVDRPGIVTLTWSVDYWDYLGWKDTFADPDFTARQQAYDHRFGLRNVYTPQLVVNGDTQIGGDKAGEVEALAAQAARTPVKGPRLRLGHGKVAVGAGGAPARAADIWLVRFDPKEHATEVKAGDNRGATVVEKNVVRQLVRLGAWKGAARQFTLPPAAEDGLRDLVLVQISRGGKILSAVTAEPPKPAS